MGDKLFSCELDIFFYFSWLNISALLEKATFLVQVVLSLHLFVFDLLIDTLLCELVPLLGNRWMLSTALLIALNLHEHPAHVFLVREFDEDLLGLKVLFRVLMGKLWRLVQRMVFVIGVILLRIFLLVA